MNEIAFSLHVAQVVATVAISICAIVFVARANR